MFTVNKEEGKVLLIGPAPRHQVFHLFERKRDFLAALINKDAFSGDNYAVWLQTDTFCGEYLPRDHAALLGSKILLNDLQAGSFMDLTTGEEYLWGDDWVINLYGPTGELFPRRPHTFYPDEVTIVPNIGKYFK